MSSEKTTLPCAFFLDDPSDGVSPIVLSVCGVHIAGSFDLPPGAGTTAEHAAAAAAATTDWSSDDTPTAALGALLSVEHSLSSRSRLSAVGGAIVVDVRDPAGAWVRLLRTPADAALIIEVRNVYFDPLGSSSLRCTLKRAISRA